MAKDNGWIKLYRSTLENPIVCKDTEFFAIWCYLLLNATHQETPTIFNGIKTILKPGQLIIGRKAISNHFGGKSTLSESKVQRVLKTLEIEHQIEQQTSNKNRLITVLNWELYQDVEQQTEQRVNTNKNVKNERIKEEILKRSVETTHPTLQDIIDFISKKRVLVDGTQVPFVTDPEVYFNKRASVGWITNGNLEIQDWRADLIAWEIREQEYKAEREIKKSGNGKIDKPEVKIDWLDQYIESL